jgi:hypothetical protein
MFWRDLLSIRVKREFKHYRGTLHRKKPLQERASEGRYLALLFTLPLAVCLAAGLSVLLTGDAQVDDPRSDEIGRLVAQAQAVGAMLASASGILIAVIVFALEIYRTNLPGGGPLPRLFATRRGYLPTAAFFLGTIASAIAVAAGGQYFGDAGLVRMAWATSGLGLAALILELLLLRQSIFMLGRESARTLLTDYFKTCHLDSLKAEIRQRIAINLFMDAARKLGFRCNVLMSSASSPNERYMVGKKGRIVDVDFGPLRRLALRWGLRPLPPKPDDPSAWDPADAQTPPSPVLTILPNQMLREERGSVALVAGNRPHDPGATILLEKALVCRERESPVPKVDWDDFTRLLKGFARQRASKDLKETLDVFGEVVEDYLHVLRRLGIKHSDDPFSGIYSAYRPPTPHAVEFPELVEATVQEGDRPCVDALFWATVSVVQTAFDEDSTAYFAEALAPLYWLYSYGAKSERLGDHVASETAARLRTISQNVIGLYVFGEDDKAGAISRVRPFLPPLLSTFLWLLRRAAETGDQEFFDKAMDALADLPDHLKAHSIAQNLRLDYDHLLWRIRMAQSHGAPADELAALEKERALYEAYLEVGDLQHLAALAVEAWTIDLVKVGKLTPEKAKPFAERAIQSMGDLRDMIEVCLFSASESPTDDHGLGYEHWDHEEIIPGKPKTRWGDAWDNCMSTGWAIVALRAAVGVQKLDPASIRPLSPVREHGCKELVDTIDAVTKDAARHAWLLGNIDLAVAKERLVDILSALRDRQEAADRASLAAADLSTAKVKTFEKECAQSYKESRRFANLVNTMCRAPTAEPTSCPRWPSSAMFRRSDYLEKAAFIESWYADYGGQEVYGEALAERESAQSAAWIEYNLRSAPPIHNFADLVATVQRIAGELRKSGFAPNVVLIPRDWRYERQVTDTPRWQRKSPFVEKHLLEWVGKIDDLDVFFWPHMNATSVAVMDLGRLVSWRETNHTEGTPLRVAIDTPSEQQIQAWLDIPDEEERKQREQDLKYAGNLETLRRTKVLVTLTADVQLGIAEMAAGVKLVSDPQTMGVAYEEGGKTYHLPECSQAQAIPADKKRYYETSAVARSKGLQPCQKCRPDTSPVE